LADAYKTQGGYAGQTYSALLGALANAYGTQGSFASNIYGAQAGAAASAYGAGTRAATDIYGSQVGAASNAYGANANFLSNTYDTGVDALSSTYNQGLGTAANIYGTQGSMYNNSLNAFVNQGNNATDQATQRAKLLMDQYHLNFQDAMTLATANQGNQQSALDALRSSYYQPGTNMLNAMSPFFGLPAVHTPVGANDFNIGNLLGAAAAAAGA
jgi:hypothetical protein